MKTITDITGNKYGKLTVMGLIPTFGHRTFWACKCECGCVTGVDGSKLKSGHTKSCGCYVKEFKKTHGESDRNMSKEYAAWAAMIQRCTNPNHPSYKHYGLRGIKVCERWLIYENFLADVGRSPDKDLSIDRINNNGNYEPGNVRWATRHEQLLNRRKKHEVRSFLSNVGLH